MIRYFGVSMIRYFDNSIIRCIRFPFFLVIDVQSNKIFVKYENKTTK